MDFAKTAVPTPFFGGVQAWNSEVQAWTPRGPRQPKKGARFANLKPQTVSNDLSALQNTFLFGKRPPQPLTLALDFFGQMEHLLASVEAALGAPDSAAAPASGAAIAANESADLAANIEKVRLHHQ